MLMFSNKNLNILAFNFVSHMDENFWFWFLQILNVSLSSILSFIVYFLSQSYFPVISTFAGLPITPEPSKVTFVLMALGALIMFVSYFIIKVYKTIQEPEGQESNLFNNLVHNPNILNDIQLFLVV